MDGRGGGREQMWCEQWTGRERMVEVEVWVARRDLRARGRRRSSMLYQGGGGRVEGLEGLSGRRVVFVLVVDRSLLEV